MTLRDDEREIALAEAGLVKVPINPRLHPREYTVMLGDCGTRAVVCGEEFLADLEAHRTALPALEHVLDVHRRALRGTLPGEEEQVAHDLRHAVALRHHQLHRAAHRRRQVASEEQLAVADDHAQRIVELVRDARNRLAERRHFFSLQKLVVNIPGLVVEFFALADITDQRLDANAAVGRRQVRGGREFNPDRTLISAAQAKQIVGDGSIGREPLEKRRARLRPVVVKRPAGP